MSIQDWIIAVVAAAGVSALAWRVGALSGGGAAAATLVGSVVLGAGGIAAAVVLVLFFVSSSALSRLNAPGERSRRSYRQVLANGSIAAGAVAFSAAHPAAYLVFLGALGSATADTWATEIGVRFGGAPRSLLTLRTQPVGSSGAVSALGTAAAALGAVSVGAVGQLLLPVAASAWIGVALAGFAGALVDSVLGDGLQAEYHCPACGARPEVARHEDCPERAKRLGGVPGLDNDIVNWITTLIGGLAALGLGGTPW